MPIIVTHDDPLARAVLAFVAGFANRGAQDQQAEHRTNLAADLARTQNDLGIQRDAARSQDDELLRTVLYNRKQSDMRGAGAALRQLAGQPEFADRRGRMLTVASLLENGVEPHAGLADYIEPSARTQSTIDKNTAQTAAVTAGVEQKDRKLNQGDEALKLRARALADRSDIDWTRFYANEDYRRAVLADTDARMAETNRHNLQTEATAAKNASAYGFNRGLTAFDRDRLSLAEKRATEAEKSYKAAADPSSGASEAEVAHLKEEADDAKRRYQTLAKTLDQKLESKGQSPAAASPAQPAGTPTTFPPPGSRMIEAGILGPAGGGNTPGQPATQTGSAAPVAVVKGKASGVEKSMTAPEMEQALAAAIIRLRQRGITNPTKEQALAELPTMLDESVGP